MFDLLIGWESFVYVILSFLALFAVHVVFWRYLKVKKMILWMFVIFVFLPVISSIALLNYLPYTQILPVLILLLAINSAYIMSYPAAQAQSPTLVILLMIHDYAKKGGASRELILEKMTSGKLIQDRLNDLENDGLIKQVDGQLEVSGTGMFLGKFFYVYRKIIGLPESKG